MTSTLVQSKVTQPSQLRDFFEWHQGVEHYGFWAIEVTNQECLTSIQYFQRYLSDQLHSNYCRQPHITLVASGLLTDSKFSQALLDQQIIALNQTKLTEFPLHLSKPNSFTTCPYLSIIDPLNRLDEFRERLNSVCPEESQGHYIPHVTLGFYNDSYKLSDVLTLLEKPAAPEHPFMVKSIIFAQYKTCEIQGPFEVLHRIKLKPVPSQPAQPHLDPR